MFVCGEAYTETEEAANTGTPNTVVNLGSMETGLVCSGHEPSL